MHQFANVLTRSMHHPHNVRISFNIWYALFCEGECGVGGFVRVQAQRGAQRMCEHHSTAGASPFTSRLRPNVLCEIRVGFCVIVVVVDHLLIIIALTVRVCWSVELRWCQQPAEPSMENSLESFLLLCSFSRSSANKTSIKHIIHTQTTPGMYAVCLDVPSASMVWIQCICYASRYAIYATRRETTLCELVVWDQHKRRRHDVDVGAFAMQNAPESTSIVFYVCRRRVQHRHEWNSPSPSLHPLCAKYILDGGKHLRMHRRCVRYVQNSSIKALYTEIIVVA